MALFCGFILMVFAVYCVSKPVEYNDYLPKESGKMNIPSIVMGDMLISPYQQLAFSGGGAATATNRKRGALESLVDVWPNKTIPYVIDSSMNAYKTKIENAMKEWEKYTCINFVPRTGQFDYLEITSGWWGCSAIIGYYQGLGPHDLGLPDGCRGNTEIVHELGHVIGFMHENQRSDRDSYVRILWKNIMVGKEQDFEKIGASFDNTLGDPYDYKSIMHYGPYAFAKGPNLKTIESKDSTVTLTYNTKISAQDAKQVNRIYGCST